MSPATPPALPPAPPAQTTTRRPGEVSPKRSTRRGATGPPRPPAGRVWVQRLIIAWFAAVLGVPMVATLAGAGRSTVDNRGAADAPAWDDGAALGDVATYEQLGRYVSDRFALRSVAVRSAARLDELLWRADTAQVRRGRDGWLFLDASLRRWCEAPLAPLDAIEAFERTIASLEAGGRRGLLAIAPEKSSIYPGQLSDRAARDGACSAELVAEARADLAGRPWYVDLYEPLLAAAGDAQAVGAAPLYHPRDTHWSPQGAALYAAAVVAALDPAAWTASALEAGAPRDFVPDLTRLLGLARTERETPLLVRRPGVHTERSAEDPPTFRSTSDASSPLVPGRTVVVHDSFGLGAFDLLAPSFAEVTFVHWDELERAEVAALLDAADTVVIEVAERTVVQRAQELDGRVLPAIETLPSRLPAGGTAGP